MSELLITEGEMVCSTEVAGPEAAGSAAFVLLEHEDKPRIADTPRALAKTCRPFRAAVGCSPSVSMTHPAEDEPGRGASAGTWLVGCPPSPTGGTSDRQRAPSHCCSSPTPST